LSNNILAKTTDSRFAHSSEQAGQIINLSNQELNIFLHCDTPKYASPSIIVIPLEENQKLSLGF